MENESTLEHDTTLEHALDVARANHKEAKRLLDQARTAYEAGEVGDDRIRQLEDLMNLTEEDLRRVMREQ
jgi:DNA-directed RNA polymerase subunit F